MSNRFTEMADELIGQVRAANIGPATEVSLILESSDEAGRELDPRKILITPTTTVKGIRDKSAASSFAAEKHVDAILGNIDSIVRGETGEPKPDRSKVTRFRLKILQPDETE